MIWEIPESDGGSEITHYLVEKRTVDRKAWQDVGKSTDLSITAKDMQDNAQYLFRVIAVNQYGNSEPAELTEPVHIKSEFCKFFLTFNLP